METWSFPDTPERIWNSLEPARQDKIVRFCATSPLVRNFKPLIEYLAERRHTREQTILRWPSSKFETAIRGMMRGNRETSMVLAAYVFEGCVGIASAVEGCADQIAPDEDGPLCPEALESLVAVLLNSFPHEDVQISMQVRYTMGSRRWTRLPEIDFARVEQQMQEIKERQGAGDDIDDDLEEEIDDELDEEIGEEIGSDSENQTRDEDEDEEERDQENARGTIDPDLGKAHGHPAGEPAPPPVVFDAGDSSVRIETLTGRIEELRTRFQEISAQYSAFAAEFANGVIPNLEAEPDPYELQDAFGEVADAIETLLTALKLPGFSEPPASLSVLDQAIEDIEREYSFRENSRKQMDAACRTLDTILALRSKDGRELPGLAACQHDATDLRSKILQHSGP